jgi:hypothetical protein
MVLGAGALMVSGVAVGFVSGVVSARQDIGNKVRHIQEEKYFFIETTPVFARQSTDYFYHEVNFKISPVF